MAPKHLILAKKRRFQHTGVDMGEKTQTEA
jgi:hypothetical protein